MTATQIPPRLVDAIRARWAANRQIRRTLPGGGRVHIDRQLPFLVVYRLPTKRPDPATGRLVTGMAAYLRGVSDRRRGVRSIVAGIAAEAGQVFGRSLVIEVWTEPALLDDSSEVPTPAFRLHVQRAQVGKRYLSRLVEELEAVSVGGKAARVEVVVSRHRAPAGFPELLTSDERRATGAQLLGLAVSPIHYDPDGTEYPLVVRELKRKLTRALSVAVFHFAREETTSRPRSYHALGRRATVKAVWEIDERLAAIGASYDFLLLVSPTNGEVAWRRFRAARYRREPEFYYRRCPVDPGVLKRRLHAIQIGRVEDPTIADLFHQQRTALDMQLSLLRDRGTTAFLHQSIALYGPVDDELRTLAQDILEFSEPRPRSGGRHLSGAEFAERADAHLATYRTRAPDFSARALVREDVTSLIVTGGNLLVPAATSIPVGRVSALLNHEVGTHLVTNYNGNRQRLRLLGSGLAGYEALQEGLGVLAEYLVGGLTPDRLRLLAARVVAARSVASGAEFIETFRELVDGFGLSRRAAFNVTLRVHRSGGFVKDAIYLRGLREVIGFLGDGGSLETLLTGKLAFSHIPVVQELQRRRVLEQPALMPAYTTDEGARRRLERLREGHTLDEMIKEILT